MINTNNFFKRNTSIRNPAAPYKKGKFVDESLEYKSRVFSRVQESPITKTLLSMRKNVLGIENSLKGLFELNKKKQATDNKFDLIEKQESKDKPKVKPAKIIGNIIERPKTGIMDAIKNFVLFTFLGWLFTRLQPLIGGLGGIAPLLQGIMNFLSGTIVGIIDVLSGFIKTGYEVKDSIGAAFSNVKKESVNIKKTFDDTISSLGELLDSTVKVATSFLDVFGQAYDNTKIADVKTEGNKIEDFSSLRTFAPTIATAFQTGGSVQQGRIDPTKTPVTRGIVQQERRVIRRKPDIQQQKTVPGKDVGGEDKVKEVYGEDISSGSLSLFSSTISDVKSGYSALLKTSEEYKRSNDRDILGLGNLMGATIDTVLGQKPEQKTYTRFAEGIKYLVEEGLSNPEEFKKIDLVMMIRRVIEPKVEATINKIQEEIRKKSRAPEPEGGGAGAGFGGDVSGGDSDFWTLVAVAFREDSDSQGQVDVAQSIYNRLLALDHGANFRQRDKSIRGIILAPWGYEPTWRYPKGATLGAGNPNPEWMAITNAETAAKAAGVDVGTIKQVASNILNPSRQESARNFIQGRTDFKAQGQGVTGISRSSRSNVFGWHYGYKKNKIANVPNFGAEIRATPEGGSSAAIGRAAEELKGMSTITGPNRGRDACVWAVNQVYKRAGIRPPWGDSNWVPNAERDMIKAGYILIPHSQRRAGDIMIMYDRETPPQAHIGVVLSNGNVLSNSTTNARFSWEATPDEYNRRYGGRGKIYRMPVKMVPKAHDAQNRINSTARVVANTTVGNFREAQDKIKNMKVGDQPLDFPGVGKVVVKKNEYGTLIKEYYLPDGITKTDVTTFNKNLRDKSTNLSQAVRRKYGGLVYKNGSPIIPEEKYASYNNPTSQIAMAIQPIIIEKPIPVSIGSGSIIAFAPPSVSPNYKSQSLSRA
jgi:hypothetical protein